MGRVRNVRVFGSIARGDDREDSDFDFLRDVEPGRTLLDVIALEQDLQQLLGRNVQVLTDGGLSPYLKHRIFAEAASDRVYLQHIRDALDDIALTRTPDVRRLAEQMRQDATIRKLQVIGQAVKNLSNGPKSRQAHIPCVRTSGSVIAMSTGRRGIVDR
jgi:uncharacterized protein